jgi:soluble cytochrome b562
MKTPLILFLQAALILTGCKRPLQNREIKGQVFIVLENRDTVKLSLTDVIAVPTDDAQKYEKKALQARREAMAEIQSQIDSLLRSVEPDQRQLDQKREEMRRFSTQLQTLGNEIELWTDKTNQLIAGHSVKESDEEISKNLKAAMKRADEEGPALKTNALKVEAEAESLRLRLADAQQQLVKLKAQLESARNIAIYVEPEKISTGKTQVTTDADGHFKVTIPKQVSISLCAKATRKTPDGNESYAWLVPLPENQNQLDMNNANLLIPAKDE